MGNLAFFKSTGTSAAKVEPEMTPVSPLAAGKQGHLPSKYAPKGPTTPASSEVGAPAGAGSGIVSGPDADAVAGAEKDTAEALMMVSTVFEQPTARDPREEAEWNTIAKTKRRGIFGLITGKTPVAVFRAPMDPLCIKDNQVRKIHIRTAPLLDDFQRDYEKLEPQTVAIQFNSALPFDAYGNPTDAISRVPFKGAPRFKAEVITLSHPGLTLLVVPGRGYIGILAEDLHALLTVLLHNMAESSQRAIPSQGIPVYVFNTRRNVTERALMTVCTLQVAIPVAFPPSGFLAKRLQREAPASGFSSGAPTTAGGVAPNHRLLFTVHGDCVNGMFHTFDRVYLEVEPSHLALLTAHAIAIARFVNAPEHVKAVAAARMESPRVANAIAVLVKAGDPPGWESWFRALAAGLKGGHKKGGGPMRWTGRWKDLLAVIPRCTVLARLAQLRWVQGRDHPDPRFLLAAEDAGNETLLTTRAMTTQDADDLFELAYRCTLRSTALSIDFERYRKGPRHGPGSAAVHAVFTKQILVDVANAPMATRLTLPAQSVAVAIISVDSCSDTASAITPGQRTLNREHFEILARLTMLGALAGLLPHGYCSRISEQRTMLEMCDVAEANMSLLSSVFMAPRYFTAKFMERYIAGYSALERRDWSPEYKDVMKNTIWALEATAWGTSVRHLPYMAPGEIKPTLWWPSPTRPESMQEFYSSMALKWIENIMGWSRSKYEVKVSRQETAPVWWAYVLDLQRQLCASDENNFAGVGEATVVIDTERPGVDDFVLSPRPYNKERLPRKREVPVAPAPPVTTGGGGGGGGARGRSKSPAPSRTPTREASERFINAAVAVANPPVEPGSPVAEMTLEDYLRA